MESVGGGVTKNTPICLRTPWKWVEPANRKELIQRLLEARDYAAPERERENLCSVAYEALRSETAPPSVREAALEECIKIAKKYLDPADQYGAQHETAASIVSLIRALKSATRDKQS